MWRYEKLLISECSPDLRQPEATRWVCGRSEEEVGTDEELQAHNTNFTYKASAASEVAGRQ